MKTIDKSEELYRSLKRKSIFVQHLEIEFKERNSSCVEEKQETNSAVFFFEC